MLALNFGLVYLFWGSTYLGIDIAVEHIPPALMCGLRFTTAGVIMLLYCLLRGETLRYSARELLQMAIVGILLLMGGNLTLCDKWTESLLTNPEVLAVDQHSTGNHEVLTTDKSSVWLARPAPGDGYYLAIFNLDSAAQTMRYLWKDVGLPAGTYRLRDLWEHKDIAPTESLTVTLQPHAAALYKVSAR